MNMAIFFGVINTQKPLTAILFADPPFSMMLDLTAFFCFSGVHGLILEPGGSFAVSGYIF